MPKEIEAKFRVDSHDPIRARLADHGARCLGCVRETNYILDRANSSLRQQGCGLRVRVAEPLDVEPSRVLAAEQDRLQSPLGKGGCDTSRIVTLTFKGPREPGSLKSREEIETEAADAGALLQVLERLGIKTILSYQKYRESWTLDECRIELDDPPHVGLFVEIEGPNESAIRNVQQRLNLRDADLVRESYVHLLADYCSAHGLSPIAVEFEH